MPAERRTELLFYTAADREFFEPYGSRPVDEQDFIDIVRGLVPASWRMRRHGIWMHCSASEAPLPTQGWKIHVSSALATGPVVLSIVAATLAVLGVSFKFAADARIHAAINGKRWSRGGSGKFITVYPRDTSTFRYVIDELRAVLAGYEGPYILSDRRCPDSGVVHYRFGGIRSEEGVSSGGQREHFIRDPEGAREPDMRTAFVSLPAWVRDPFPPEAADTGPANQLGKGRYEVRSALAFSAAGGIYLALDRDTGHRVVIKEARPHIGGQHLATHLLLKEYRLLRRLAPLGVVPAPVEYFREWEHHYLVEEHIEGQTLRAWLAMRYPWLKTRATRTDVVRFLHDVCDIYRSLARVLEKIHAAGVSLGDFSFHNVMVEASGHVRIIDLEAAVEDGLDAAPGIGTPGFSSRMSACDDHKAACVEDRYAFGANLFAAMMPVNAMLPLDPHAAMRFTRQVCEDMGYPAILVNAIAALLDNEPARRPSPVAIMDHLGKTLTDLPGGDAPVPHLEQPVSPAANAAGDLFRYIEAMAAKARPDRYVPADPQVFERHPWGVAYGAAGILHACHRGGRRAPDGLLGYIIDGIRAPRDRGSDLMHGDAGIAWVLFDAGETEAAIALLRGSSIEGPIREHHGLDDGMAGWGLARLNAWLRTHDESFLADATKAGDALLVSGPCVNGRRCWRPDDAWRPVGLGQGAAGVALFLLHLSMATGQSRFFDAAHEALAFDLDQHAFNVQGERTWRKVVGGAALLPYLRHGTAGILAVVARFFAATGDSVHRDFLLANEADLMRRHAISPRLSDGLAGIGEALLDLAHVMPERAAHYVSQAHRLAGGIEPFLIRRPEGLAIAGTESLRLSCDLATGNAGVAAFFDRLWSGGMASFMLDEHLPTVKERTRAALA